MLLLEEKVRDELVNALQSQIVPAGAGSTLMAIVRVLVALPAQEEAPQQEPNDSIKKDENE